MGKGVRKLSMNCSVCGHPIILIPGEKLTYIAEYTDPTMRKVKSMQHKSTKECLKQYKFWLEKKGIIDLGLYRRSLKRRTAPAPAIHPETPEENR